MANISIHIQSHVILTPFVWVDIPSFAILTGANGVGKTLLLKGIFNFFDSNVQRYRGNYNPPISVNSESTLIGEVIYFDSNGSPLSSNNLVKGSDIPNNIINSYAVFRTGDTSKQYEEIEKLIGKNRDEISLEEFDEAYKEPSSLNFSDLSSNISRSLVAYFKNIREAKADGWTDEKCIKKFGSAPWDKLNQLISSTILPYTFPSPTKYDVNEKGYTLKLIDLNNREILLDNLSSGEKILMSLLFYSYVAEMQGKLPKMLLLDEPDAHLHPQMTKYFLNVIENIFVEKYKIRVLMTTHSPSTIALAPEVSLFEMQKNPTSIQSITKNRAIALLTSGLVFVSTATKYVFVEDKDDVDFYTNLYQIFVEQKILDNDVALVFIEASTKTKSGGKAKVKEWIDKISPLSSQFDGLIDRDVDNDNNDHVDFSTLNIISRYSIENYWTDPLNIYLTMISQNLTIKGFSIKQGDGYSIKFLSVDKVQSIVDEICNLLFLEAYTLFSSKGIIISKEPRDVIYYIRKNFLAGENELVSPINLKYPAWIIDNRGKDILNQIVRKGLVNAGFNAAHMTPDYLRMIYQSNYFLPKDILDVFLSIQSKVN